MEENIGWQNVIQVILKVLLPVLGGAAIAIYGEVIKKRITGAKLEAEYDEERGIFITPHETENEGKYIVVKLSNTGSIYAKKVIARLECVEFKTDEQKTWDNVFFIPMGLVWSYVDQDMPVYISPQSFVYFNVFYVIKKSNVFRPHTVKKPLAWNDKLNKIGTYRFCFSITGEEIRYRLDCSIELKWSGSYDDFVVGNFAVDKK